MNEFERQKALSDLKSSMSSEKWTGTIGIIAALVGVIQICTSIAATIQYAPVTAFFAGFMWLIWTIVWIAIAVHCFKAYNKKKAEAEALEHLQ